MKNILSDPPHGLGAASNFLLLASIVLLASLFFIDPKEEDIAMNIISQVQEMSKEEAQNQNAEQSYAELFPFVEKGDNVEKGDTIFSKFSSTDIATMEEWIESLRSGKFKPLKEMLSLPFVNMSIKKKMIELAEVQMPKHQVNNKTLAELNSRITELEADVIKFQQSVQVYESALDKFKRLESDYEKEFFTIRQEKFEKGLVSAGELKKYKKQWDDIVHERKLRENELKRVNGTLSERQSELDVMSDRKNHVQSNRKKSDNTFHEADLKNSLASLLESSFVFSKYEGKVGKIGDLIGIDVGDTLLEFEGAEVKSHNSKTLIAEIVDEKNAKKVVPGRELNIYLQDGSVISGEVIKLSDSKEHQFVIASSVELTSIDVDQIIIPKNENFIEKVMQNF